jgi:hypothetical protein
MFTLYVLFQNLILFVVFFNAMEQLYCLFIFFLYFGLSTKMKASILSMLESKIYISGTKKALTCLLNEPMKVPPHFYLLLNMLMACLPVTMETGVTV